MQPSKKLSIHKICNYFTGYELINYIYWQEQALGKNKSILSKKAAVSESLPQLWIHNKEKGQQYDLLGQLDLAEGEYAEGFLIQHLDFSDERSWRFNGYAYQQHILNDYNFMHKDFLEGQILVWSRAEEQRRFWLLDSLGQKHQLLLSTAAKVDWRIDVRSRELQVYQLDAEKGLVIKTVKL